MQYRSKVALLAVALFGTSALAAPLAGEVEYEIEVREVDNDLAARETYDSYLEARAEPSFVARDLESMDDLEAREYLEYLEARASATMPLQTPLPPQTPQTPLTPQTPQPPMTPMSATSVVDNSPKSNAKDEHIFLSKHQKAMRKAKKVAAKEFKDAEVYQNALLDKEAKYHRFAVMKYLSNPSHLKAAYSNSDSRFHKAAVRAVHRRRAAAFLAEEGNFEKALKHKHNKFHKDAVKKYLSQGSNFEDALVHKKSPYHKAAVHEYLLDKTTRKAILADKSNALYKAAVKMEKKIRKHQRKHHKHSKSTPPSDIPPAASPTPVASN